MTIRIDKRIPIPPPKRGGTQRGGGAPEKYPWSKLEVGDSFLLHDLSQARAASLASAAGARLGKKFVTRITKKGVRVWRVS